MVISGDESYFPPEADDDVVIFGQINCWNICGGVEF